MLKSKLLTEIMLKVALTIIAPPAPCPQVNREVNDNSRNHTNVCRAPL